MKKIIYLQKIGDLDSAILKKLKRNLKKSLNDYINSVKILREIIPIADFEYNSKRMQFNDLILKEIIRTFKNGNYFRILGVIDKDIYFKTSKIIFGKRLSKSYGIALIAIARLRESFLEKPENKALFELRILKEAIHELGHTFNLKHCNNFCVMRSAGSKPENYPLTNIDEKPAKFCNDCISDLKLFFSGKNKHDLK